MTCGHEGTARKLLPVGAKLTAQTANVRATTCFYPRHGYAGGVPSINDGVDEIEFEKLW